MVDIKHGHGKDSVTIREGAVIRASGSKTIVEVGAGTRKNGTVERIRKAD